MGFNGIDMKTLRIRQSEIQDIFCPPVRAVSPRSYLEFYIKNKLIEFGFDLSKKYISYKDFETMDIIFEQEE